jgi:hypothetical protein
MYNHHATNLIPGSANPNSRRGTCNHRVTNLTPGSANPNSQYGPCNHRVTKLTLGSECSPALATVATDQPGFHVSGWKSDMLRHSRVPVANLPTVGLGLAPFVWHSRLFRRSKNTHSISTTPRTVRVRSSLLTLSGDTSLTSQAYIIANLPPGSARQAANPTLRGCT